MDWSPTFLAYLVGIHLIRPWSLITLLFWPVMCNSTSQPTNSFPFLVNRYLTSPHGAFTLASDCIYWWKNFPFGCAFTSRVSVAVTLASCACAIHSDSFEVRFGDLFSRETHLRARLLNEEHPNCNCWNGGMLRAKKKEKTSCTCARTTSGCCGFFSRVILNTPLRKLADAVAILMFCS